MNLQTEFSEVNYVRFQGFSPAAECSFGGRTDHELVLPTCVLGAKLSLPQPQTLSILLTFSKELVLCCLQMRLGSTQSSISLVQLFQPMG